MTESPRVKRLYQPSINSFFHQRITDENAVPLQPKDERQHAIDTSVQASLLSVGMRIRKAVPAGYQSATKAVKPVLRPMSPAEGNQREVQPFCGLHKVGGLMQPLVVPQARHAPRGVLAQSQDASPNSTADMNTSTQQSRKRSLSPDADQEEDAEMDTESLQAVSAARLIARPRKPRYQRPIAAVAMEICADFEEAPFLMPRE